MRIKLCESIGENCQSVDEGKMVHGMILQEMREGRSVEIDFSGVKMILTPFLNMAFGKLFDFFDKNRIMSALQFRNISAEHLKKVNELIDYVDGLDSDKIARETLEELYGEDSLSDDGLM